MCSRRSRRRSSSRTRASSASSSHSGPDDGRSDHEAHGATRQPGRWPRRTRGRSGTQSHPATLRHINRLITGGEDEAGSRSQAAVRSRGGGAGRRSARGTAGRSGMRFASGSAGRWTASTFRGGARGSTERGQRREASATASSTSRPISTWSSSRQAHTTLPSLRRCSTMSTTWSDCSTSRSIPSSWCPVRRPGIRRAVTVPVAGQDGGAHEPDPECPPAGPRVDPVRR